MRTLTGISGFVLLFSLVLSGPAWADGITVITGTSAPPAARALGPPPEPAPPAAGRAPVVAGVADCLRGYRAWGGSFNGDGQPGPRSDEVRRNCRAGLRVVIGYEGGRYGDWRYRARDANDNDADRPPAVAATVAPVPVAPGDVSAAAPVEPCGPERSSASVGGAAWTVEGSSCSDRPRIWQLTPADQD